MNRELVSAMSNQTRRDSPLFSSAQKRGVLVIGPLEARGGVAAVVRGVTANPRLEGEWRIVPINTTCYQDGGLVRKFLQLCVALAKACATLWSDPDIVLVHVHAGGGVSILRKLLFLSMARLMGRKTILHIHSGELAKLCTSPSTRGRAIRRSLRKCDAVVVLADRDRRELAMLDPAIVVRVVRNPVTLPSGDTMGRSVSLASPRLAYMGYLFRDKGVYDLLDALSLVTSVEPGVKCTFYGKGPELSGIRHKARALGLESSVQLAGWVTGDAWEDAFASADILVLPSYSEGMPLVILEAMARGVPTICTAVGAIPEIVENGVTGILVQPGNPSELAGAIWRLCDHELRLELSCNALLAVSAYATEAVAQEWATLYRDTVAGYGGSGVVGTL